MEVRIPIPFTKEGSDPVSPPFSRGWEPGAGCSAAQRGQELLSSRSRWRGSGSLSGARLSCYAFALRRGLEAARGLMHCGTRRCANSRYQCMKSGGAARLSLVPVRRIGCCGHFGNARESLLQRLPELLHSAEGPVPGSCARMEELQHSGWASRCCLADAWLGLTGVASAR
ncbi:hypothetical protein NDU88_003779 [Pleurodeles waltl]|uniref:Uncharacterized protein n=1 Tax=Pleurodeles waltl TaxID=8319 RepID=A0AAV7VF64_PLEWA|nr:hypothetical protein NDU88_003779 [Pleurodeles waltl]